VEECCRTTWCGQQQQGQSYACSLVHSELSWWGLTSSFHSHVAHMFCVAVTTAVVVILINLVCVHDMTQRISAVLAATAQRVCAACYSEKLWGPLTELAVHRAAGAFKRLNAVVVLIGKCGTFVTVLKVI
jgi:hypothetical protein